LNVVQYRFASEVVSGCRENAQLMHSLSAEVNNGYNASAAMKLARLEFLGFLIFIEETNKDSSSMKHFSLVRKFPSHWVAKMQVYLGVIYHCKYRPTQF
jgi:hypothetical protein